MSEENKDGFGMNMIALSQKNVDAKFQVIITQADVVEASVSEIENILHAELESARKEIKNNEKEVKRLRDEMKVMSQKALDEKFKAKGNSVVAILDFAQKLTATFGVSSVSYKSEKPEILGCMSLKDKCSGRDVVCFDVRIPAPTMLLAKFKTSESIVERNNDLSRIEFEISDKLKHVDRYMRQAKAKITREMLEKAGLTSIIPKLNGEV